MNRATSLDEHRMYCRACRSPWLAIGRRPRHCCFCGERNHRMSWFEVVDRDCGDVLAAFDSEVDACASYEVACATDADWLRRLAVGEVNDAGHVVRWVREPE